LTPWSSAALLGENTSTTVVGFGIFIVLRSELLGAVCGMWLASWLLSEAGADEAMSPEAQL
jgi:hypothetical protein